MRDDVWPQMLERLNLEEVEQALALVRYMKGRFAATAQDVLKHARDNGINDRVACTAVAGDAILLAAYMYGDSIKDRRAFLEMASWAFTLAMANLEQDDDDTTH